MEYLKSLWKNVSESLAWRESLSSEDKTKVAAVAAYAAALVLAATSVFGGFAGAVVLAASFAYLAYV